MTTRPLLLRMVPPSLRMRLYCRLYRRHAADAGALLEAGASYGQYSILWSAHHPANRVRGFEAPPRNPGSLPTSLEPSRLASRVEVRAIARGAQPGAATPAGPEFQPGWVGLTDNPVAGTISVCVPVETLD